MKRLFKAGMMDFEGHEMCRNYDNCRLYTYCP
uniref:Uncharacterized protein n=1 Tax=Anguilla anguilla TaxID=7936 RepID=A0A0E9VJ77_ANGAN